MGELDPEINPELPKDFKLDCVYILVNAAECEPGLEHNTRQIEEQSDKLIRGIKYSMEITHAKKAIIAIKKKHHKAIKVLQQLDLLLSMWKLSVRLLKRLMKRNLVSART